MHVAEVIIKVTMISNQRTDSYIYIYIYVYIYIYIPFKIDVNTSLRCKNNARLLEYKILFHCWRNKEKQLVSIGVSGRDRNPGSSQESRPHRA